MVRTLFTTNKATRCTADTVSLLNVPVFLCNVCILCEYLVHLQETVPEEDGVQEIGGRSNGGPTGRKGSVTCGPSNRSRELALRI